MGRLKKEWVGRGLDVVRADPSPAPRRVDEMIAATMAEAEPELGEVAPTEMERLPAEDAPPIEMAAGPADMSAASTEEGSPQTIRAQAVTSSRGMQHAGTWLMIAMLHRLGLYVAAEEACADASVNTRKALRIAMDAFVCALAIGEGCVEGVRRLMTSSGPALVQAGRLEGLGVELQRRRRGVAACAADALLLQRCGMRGAVGAQEELR